MRTLTYIIFILFLSSAMHAANFEQAAPLRYRNQNPVYLQVPSLRPIAPRGLTAGQHELSINTSYSNIFEYFETVDHEVLIDTELLRSELAWSHGLGRGFTIGVQLPILHSGGGFLDPFISWWHNTFSLPNAGRELFADNQHQFRIRDLNPDTTLYRVPSIGLGLGDLNLSVQYRVREQGAGPGITLFHNLELPTGQRSKGSSNRSLDYNLGFALDKSWGRWHLHWQTAYSVASPATALQPFMHEAQLNYLLGLAVNIPKQLALHAQIHGGTPLLSTIANGRWNDMPLDFIVGISGDHDRFFWQLGFAEDLHANGPSIDFTALLEFGYRL